MLETFVRKPILATTLAITLVIFGFVAYKLMPVRLFPLVPASFVTVTTTYPGANPQTMEGFVSTPIEQALGGLSGVDYISAANTPGQSVVTLKFFLKSGALEKALPQITNRVQSVLWKLPKGINSPVITKVDPNGGPGQAIMYIGFGSKVLTREQVTDYLTRTVKPQIEALPGVAAAQIFGGQPYAMRIWIDPRKLAAHNLTASDVANALRSQNLQATAGKIKGKYTEFNVSTNTDLRSAAAFNELVIKGGVHPVRIQDIGHAALGAATNNVSAILMGPPSEVIGVEIQDNANAIQVSNEVHHLMKSLHADLPSGVWMKLLADMTDFNRASIKEVHHTMLEACIFVFIVIFIFLGSARSVVIPVITIPISLLGGCALMWAFGFSNNTLTLLAWVLAIGLVVDDAIVVLENIHRHMEEGMKRIDAAIASLAEIKSAIVVMTLAVAVVFLPIGFIPGISGALFKEFAYTLSMVVLISGVLALLLTPMMCTVILPKLAQVSRITHFIDRYFEHFRQGYKRVLTEILHMRWLIGMIFIALLAGGYLLLNKTPSELIPTEDTGVIIGIGLGPPGVNIDYLRKYGKQFQYIYEHTPEMQTYGIFSGWPDGADQITSFLALKPHQPGMRNENQVLGSVLEQMNRVSGLLAFAIKRPILPGAALEAPVEFVVKTNEPYAKLNEAMQALDAAAAKYPGIIAPTVNMQMSQQQVNINVNRQKAAVLGIQSQQIADTLAMFFAKPIIQWFDYQGRSYQVIPQVYRQFRYNPHDINAMYLRSASGELVPMSSITSVNTSMSPNTLNQFAQMHSATLSGQVAPGYTIGQVLGFLKQFVTTHLNQHYQYDFSGQSRQFIQSEGVLVTAFLFAVVLIYLLLAAFFNSFIAPVVVMVSVPLAVVGALYTMYLADVTLNIYTKIGLIMLVGLISKHGILIVHFAHREMEKGLEPMAAVIEAASIRLRPILMTTFAMIASAIPLVLAGGAGATARQDIGWVVVGGMALGTVLTLFVVPTAYSVLMRKPHTAE